MMKKVYICAPLGGDIKVISKKQRDTLNTH